MRKTEKRKKQGFCPEDQQQQITLIAYITNRYIEIVGNDHKEEPIMQDHYYNTATNVTCILKTKRELTSFSNSATHPQPKQQDSHTLPSPLTDHA